MGNVITILRKTLIYTSLAVKVLQEDSLASNKFTLITNNNSPKKIEHKSKVIVRANLNFQASINSGIKSTEINEYRSTSSMNEQLKQADDGLLANSFMLI